MSLTLKSGFGRDYGRDWVYEHLHHYFRSERENQRQCQACSKIINQRNVKRTITDASDMLLISLPLYTDKGERHYPSIAVNMNLDLSRYCSNAQQVAAGDLRYKLASIIYFVGQEISTGHYVNHVKSPRPHWNFINCDEVSNIGSVPAGTNARSEFPWGIPDRRDLEDADAYILMYVRNTDPPVTEDAIDTGPDQAVSPPPSPLGVRLEPDYERLTRAELNRLVQLREAGDVRKFGEPASKTKIDIADIPLYRRVIRRIPGKTPPKGSGQRRNMNTMPKNITKSDIVSGLKEWDQDYNNIRKRRNISLQEYRYLDKAKKRHGTAKFGKLDFMDLHEFEEDYHTREEVEEKIKEIAADKRTYEDRLGEWTAKELSLSPTPPSSIAVSSVAASSPPASSPPGRPLSSEHSSSSPGPSSSLDSSLFSRSPSPDLPRHPPPPSSREGGIDHPSGSNELSSTTFSDFVAGLSSPASASEAGQSSASALPSSTIPGSEVPSSTMPEEALMSTPTSKRLPPGNIGSESPLDRHRLERSRVPSPEGRRTRASHQAKANRSRSASRTNGNDTSSKAGNSKSTSGAGRRSTTPSRKRRASTYPLSPKSAAAARVSKFPTASKRSGSENSHSRRRSVKTPDALRSPSNKPQTPQRPYQAPPDQAWRGHRRSTSTEDSSKASGRRLSSAAPSSPIGRPGIANDSDLDGPSSGNSLSGWGIEDEDSSDQRSEGGQRHDGDEDGETAGGGEDGKGDDKDHQGEDGGGEPSSHTTRANKKAMKKRKHVQIEELPTAPPPEKKKRKLFWW